jgi:putative ABC transport system permease protein
MTRLPRLLASARAGLARLRGTFAPRRSDRDLEEELHAHADLAAEDAARAGDAAAGAGARRQLGVTVPAAIEALRDRRALPWLRDLGRDLQYGARLLRRAPLFAAAAVVSLALGIGATTAVFSLVDAVLLRELPVRAPRELVQFVSERPPYGRGAFSYPLYASLRDEGSSFNGVLAQASLGRRNVTVGGDAEAVEIDLVSGNYFTLLGVDAAIGRVIAPDADAIGAPAEAVLGHAFWQRRFGRDPGVIGRTIRIRDVAVVIVGVTPPEFFGTSLGRVPDITLPLAMDGVVRGSASWRTRPQFNWLNVMGRLPAGRGATAAQAEVQAIVARVNEAEAAERQASGRTEVAGRTVSLQAAAGGFDDLRQRFARPLQMLMAIVALLLLMACANLANLLLGRAVTRRQEMALRRALGASRGRVVRQLFAEGVLLASLGAVLGIGLASLLANGLIAMMARRGSSLPLAIGIDARLIAFTIVTALTSCVLFSVVPALRLARPETRAQLDGGRVTWRWRLGPTLMASQIAISVLLLIVGGLFGRTLWSLSTFDAGFARHGVLLFGVDAAKAGYAGPRLAGLQVEIAEGMAALPGVTSSSLTLMPPISGGGWDGEIQIDGDGTGAGRGEVVHLNAVGPGYFATLGAPMVRGREFAERDTASGTKVAIVNETFVQRHLGQGVPALGRRLRGPAFGEDRFEIVGVVKDMRYQSLRQATPPTVFFALRQSAVAPQANTYVVRTTRMEAARAALPAVLARIDPRLSASSIQTIGEHVAASIVNERMLAALSGGVGALSLLLVSVGVFGTVAFQVAQRTKEIGIRLALGGRPTRILVNILGGTMTPVLVGCAIGATAAVAVTRVAETALFGVTPTDAPTFIAACGALLTVAWLAAWARARHALRVNPAVTLRGD